MRKIPYLILILIFLVQILAPLIGLLLFTVQTGSSWSFTNYAQLFQDSSFITSLINSLWISLTAVFISILIFTIPAWHAYIFYPRLVKWISAISYIPFVIPAVVLALAYVQFFSSGWLNLAGTPILLPFAFSLLGMPFYMEAVLNRLRLQNVRVYLEASRTLGARDMYSFLRIQLPILSQGIISGSILVFTISMGEFAITQLTTGGSYTTLPIYMMIAFTNNPLEGSAMAILTLLITTLGILFGLMATHKSRRRKKQYT